MAKITTGKQQQVSTSASGAIDPSLIKFFVGLGLLAILTEVVSQFSDTASWTLFFILILGVLFNNPILIGFISSGANALNS